MIDEATALIKAIDTHDAAGDDRSPRSSRRASSSAREFGSDLERRHAALLTENTLGTPRLRDLTPGRQVGLGNNVLVGNTDHGVPDGAC